MSLDYIQDQIQGHPVVLLLVPKLAQDWQAPPVMKIQTKIFSEIILYQSRFRAARLPTVQKPFNLQ